MLNDYWLQLAPYSLGLLILASIHRDTERSSRKPTRCILCSILHEYSRRVAKGSKPK